MFFIIGCHPTYDHRVCHPPPQVHHCLPLSFGLQSVAILCIHPSSSSRKTRPFLPSSRFPCSVGDRRGIHTGLARPLKFQNQPIRPITFTPSHLNPGEVSTQLMITTNVSGPPLPPSFVFPSSSLSPTPLSSFLVIRHPVAKQKSSPRFSFSFFFSFFPKKKNASCSVLMCSFMHSLLLLFFSFDLQLVN